jgi:hypothetical protein
VPNTIELYIFTFQYYKFIYKHPGLIKIIGIDKKFQSFSFFCCSLYIGDPGVFVKKVSVCVSAACRTEKWLETFFGAESKPKTH